MANLEMDGKKLSKGIKLCLTARSKLNPMLHELACSAVALASIHGRVEWLNELASGLTKGEADMLRAWLAPTAFTFQKRLSDEDKGKVWLASVKGVYAIKKDTAALRPTYDAKTGQQSDLSIIQSVADDFDNKFFLNKSVNKAAAELAWDESIANRISSVLKAVTKEADTSKHTKTVVTRLDAVAKIIRDAEEAVRGLSKLEVVEVSAPSPYATSGHPGNALALIEPPTPPAPVEANPLENIAG